MNIALRATLVVLLSSLTAACGGPVAVKDERAGRGSVSIPVDVSAQTGAYVGRVCRFGYLPAQACKTTQAGYVGGACSCPSAFGGTFSGKVTE
jgi:hypothetical protein